MKIIKDNTEYTSSSILAYFQTLNVDFLSKLKSDVELEAYCEKLSNNADFYTARLGDTAIGMLAFYSDIKQKDIYITHLSVRSGFERKGIGRELLERLFDDFPEYSTTLEVNSENTAAFAFYLHLDFNVTSETYDKKVLRRQGMKK